MKKLSNNQQGAGHILLIIVFLVALSGLIAFAYLRINDSNSDESADSSLIEGEEEASTEEDDSEAPDEGDEEDPSEGVGEEEEA